VLTIPQPFEDLGHVADVGVRVRGATAQEALGRLALALGTLLAGGGPLAPEEEERVEVEGGPGLAGTAVSFLRELLYRFATRRVVPAAVEVLQVDEVAVEAQVRWARWDPDVHAEGMDVKAVTWHLAMLEHEGGEWIGQAVFDI
jgi:SHS2 domain-containing protein